MKTLFKKLSSYIIISALLLGFVFSHSIESHAQVEGFGVTFSTFFSSGGWSEWANDNRSLSKTGEYPTALKIGLYGQKDGLTGTVLYQVNLSGRGWLAWVENGEETGAADLGEVPLEAIRVKLNGDLADKYDIYTKVLQAGSWTDWSKNGEKAGTDGVGTHIDGIRISIVEKGASEPEEIKLSKVDPDRPMVALTFDDGPNSPVTNRIIAALDAVGGRGTFFMVGSRVNGAGIDSIKRMVAGGHELGNHTFRHEQLVKMTKEQAKENLGNTNHAVINAVGASPTVMRPTYGAYNVNTLEALKELNMPAILWNIDTLDWKHKDAKSTVDAILNFVKDGDIVLMHDLYESTAIAVETAVPELIKRGYQLVTVSELAEYRGGMKAGSTYSSFRKR